MRAMFLPPGHRMRSVLENLNWQQDESPLYTDDQRFLTETGDYGPHAGIYPSPSLKTLSLAQMRPSGSAGTLVAIVDVTMDPGATTLPGTYTDLHLSPGTNCIYLRASEPMIGYVIPARASAPHCDSTATAPRSLRVVRVQSGSDSIPAVGRFHEGVNDARAIKQGAPYFGTKCADGWCYFLGENVAPLDPPQLSDGNSSHVYTKMGWGDAQHLSIKAANPIGLRRSTQHAFVVPAENLGRLGEAEFRQGWQLVATVKFVSGGPKAKYSDNWHFEPTTENKIYVRIDTATNKWESVIERRTYIFPWLPLPWIRSWYRTIDREDHEGMDIPGIARFRWDKDDEDLWVRCDDGCCKISDLQ